MNLNSYSLNNKQYNHTNIRYNTYTHTHTHTQQKIKYLIVYIKQQLKNIIIYNKSHIVLFEYKYIYIYILTIIIFNYYLHMHIYDIYCVFHQQTYSFSIILRFTIQKLLEIIIANFIFPDWYYVMFYSVYSKHPKNLCSFQFCSNIAVTVVVAVVVFLVVFFPYFFWLKLLFSSNYISSNYYCCHIIILIINIIKAIIFVLILLLLQNNLFLAWLPFFPCYHHIPNDVVSYHLSTILCFGCMQQPLFLLKAFTMDHHHHHHQL